MNTFLFGNEKPGLQSFFLTAARRFAICFPIAGVISISAADGFKLLILFCWLCSGHWTERIKMLFGRRGMLIVIPLIVWSLGGVVRCFETDYTLFFRLLRYWWADYPFFFMFILATLFVEKKTRSATLSAINVAVLLFWCNFIFIRYIYSPDWGIPEKNCTFLLLVNTIGTGVGLAIWSMLWICVPYTSLSIPLVRRILPIPVLRGMKMASKTSPLDLIFALNPFVSTKRLPICGIIFTIIRWGVVCFAGYYIFLLNPSREGQLLFLVSVTIGLLFWNWKSGLVLALIISMSLGIFAAYGSHTFARKLQATGVDIVDFVTKDKDEIERRDRHWIMKQLIPVIKEKPVAGYGLDYNSELVYKITGYEDTHCAFTKTALELGCVGLAFYILWLALLLLSVMRSSAPENKFMFAVLFIAVIDSLLGSTFSIAQNRFTMITLLAVVHAQIYISHPPKLNSVGANRSPLDE